MKTTNLLIVFIIISSIAFSACSPSEEQIQKAISQTQAAQPTSTQAPTPTATNTVIPTNTPTPTFTPEPTLTPTPTATLTPTPDLRVIDIDPKTFLLEVSDLPLEGKYFLPGSSWISPHRNSEIISSWGTEKGRVYLEATGRVDGWWVQYFRCTKTVNMPSYVWNNPVMYKTQDGAKSVFNNYSYCADPDRGIKDGFLELSGRPKVGDDSQWCMMKEMQPNGKNKVWLRIEYIYRNYYQSVQGYGWESEVTPEFIEGVANTLLEKLKAAPLSDTVTFSP